MMKTAELRWVSTMLLILLATPALAQSEAPMPEVTSDMSFPADAF